jgi:site-specific DNA recombinase
MQQRAAVAKAEAKRKRCAVYTRKSSEEGLEQEFNSLAAQREACEAYIRSQQHEGWVLARTHYDDGGFSGGNIERPALQQLLADIRAGRIDIVIVYKVDRLTRSLADFARLVEIFDKEGVSFVSVTQQFNTTSSMGRLTLNVLLSFAQFEREVTGERIRDKIAASKRKGMWMGGLVPLGYDASERGLVINPAEAETVRRIFALYREFGCVRRVKEEADRLELRTKRRTAADGTERGGRPLSRGHIYQLLGNPIYTGQIAHRGRLYPGQHPSLIDSETWGAVRDQLGANAGKRQRKTRATEPSLLAGLLFDSRGGRLTPSHAIKRGRRYRYYISAVPTAEAARDHVQNWRLAAREIEDAVITILVEALHNPTTLLDRFGTAGISSDQIRRLFSHARRLATTLSGAPGQRTAIVRELVEKVIIDVDGLAVRVRNAAVLGGTVASPAPDSASNPLFELKAAVAFRRRGVTTKLVLPGEPHHCTKCDPTLIKAIARGHLWFEELATGRARSLDELATREGITRRYIRRLVNLAFLSPQLIETILQGRQPVALTATRLTELDLPLDWSEQRRLLAS